MARNNIEVVITVRDGASKPLENVQDRLRRTGKAAKDASIDFVQFNKTLFTTSAFIATFVKGISSMRNAMELGGDLDRLSNQYERLLGPKGKLFESIDAMTTTAISRMDALRAAIDLRNLGIASDSNQIAGVIAKAGTAAKLAGLDASQGIEKFTHFLKDGSVANLEALGLIKRTDPQFQALMATLNKVGGTYGGVISTQAKLNIGMALLNKRVEGQLKNLRDLKDLNVLLNDSFGILKRQIGGLLGQALRPLIEKLIPLVYKLGDVLEHIQKNEKQIVFLARAFIILTGAVTGLVATLGTLKLMVKLLGFAGIGMPGLLLSVLAVTSSFVGLTHAADGALEKLRVLGAIFKGIYELVTNLDPETGMSKISKSTRDLLEKYGLLGFVKTISRIVAIIKTVLSDVYKVFKTVAMSVDKIFGGMFTKFKDVVANFTSDWTTWWTSDALSPIQKFVRSATVILTGFLAVFGIKKLAGLAGGLLGKIPGIGKFFGGGSGPKGTSSDPLYVVPQGFGGMAGGVLGSTMGKIPGIGTLIDLLKQSYKLGGWKQILKDIPAAFSLAFPKLTRIIGSISSVFMAGARSLIGGLTGVFARIVPMVSAAIPLLGPALAVAAAAAVGVAIGTLIDKYGPTFQGKTDEGYEGGLIERGMFKLSKWSGLGPAGDFIKNQEKLDAFKNKSDLQLINEHRAKQGKLPYTQEEYDKRSGMGKKQTSISVPSSVPADDLSIVQALGEQMKNMDEKDRAKMQSAVETALQSQGKDGRLIDSEEFKNFETIMVNALDSSENLTILAGKARQSISTLKGSKRD